MDDLDLETIFGAAQTKLAGLFHMVKIFAKGGFFSESAMCFLDLQISKKNIPKNYPELEI